jgi:tetratricopeptide (TPR) repeat protein
VDGEHAVIDDADGLWTSLAAIEAAVPLTSEEEGMLEKIKQDSEAAAGAPHLEAPLKWIPGFEIIRVLGRGGMSVVYEARQIKLGRTVALKVILAGPHASPEMLARFRREASLLAKCADAGVVTLYDFDVVGGQPYLAMENCTGGTLAEAMAGRPLPPNAGADIAFRLSQTMAVVHSVGLIHRDLKPDNVFLASPLTGNWRWEKIPLKIGDFGLAKLESSGSALTASNATPGTPEYMAPEQVVTPRAVGPATDIYALGAILYELLTGRRPFQGATNQDTLRQVVEKEPVGVRALQPSVPRDLETICLKCLQKNPASRYATVAELADDLGRYERGEPITARPIGGSTYAWRWCCRNRALTISLATIAALVVVSVCVLTTELIAVARLNTGLESERNRALIARNQTLDVLDSMVSDTTGDSLMTQQSLLPEQRKFLQNVISYYVKFSSEPGDDREDRVRLARVHLKLGMIYGRLRQIQEATAVFRRGTELYARLVDESPDVREYRRDLAGGLNNLGMLDSSLNQPELAEAEYRQAMDIRQRLAKEFPGDLQYRRDVVASHNNIGILLMRRGQRLEAATEYRRAVDICEVLAAESPKVPQIRNDLARSHNNLGLVFMDLGHRPAAEREYRRAIEVQLKLVADSPDVPGFLRELARSHLNLGLVLADDVKRRPEAVAEYRKALEIREKLAYDYPSDPDFRSELARGHNHLGVVLKELKQWPEAEAEYRRALTLRSKLVEEKRDAVEYAADLAGTCVNLGSLMSDRGEPESALPWYARAIATLEPILHANPRQVMARQFLRNAHWNRAEAFSQLGRHALAIADWETALKLDDGANRIFFNLRRARALARAGQTAKAVAAAAELASAKGARAGVLYDCACIVVLAAATPGNANADRQAAQAIDLLKQALAAGYTDIAHLLGDSDLAPLRRQNGYHEFLWNIADSSTDQGK